MWNLNWCNLINCEMGFSLQNQPKLAYDETKIGLELAIQNESLFYRIYAHIRDSIKLMTSGSQEEQFLIEARRKYAKAIRNLANERRIDLTRYSINENFVNEYDRWDKQQTGIHFRTGTTSEALQSIGIDDKNIYFDSSKIIQIKNKHPEMTDDIIKDIPEILENPIMILQSKTRANRVVVFGEVVDEIGNPVMTALELKPTFYGNEIGNFVKIASAYAKKKGKGLQKLINESDVLYLDENKNRTESWFQLLRLQLPAEVTNFGSISNVTYVNKDVNGKIYFDDEKNSYMRDVLRKAEENKKFSLDTSQIKNRSFQNTVQAAPSIHEDFARSIQHEVDSGTFAYEVIHDRDSLARVNHALQQNGLDKYLYSLESKLNEGKHLTKDDIVMGQRLIQEYIKLGDSEKAMYAVTLTAEAGTQAGQMVQAMSMMRRLTPEGQLMALNRITQKLTNEYVKPGEQEITLSKERAKDIMMSDTPERLEQAVERAKEDVYNQVPVTMMDKINAWRYLSMLGNPKTHIRNILGNFVFYPTRMMKNQIARGLESAFIKGEKTKSFLTYKDKGLIELGKYDYSINESTIKGESKYADSKMMYNRQIFNYRTSIFTLSDCLNQIPVRLLYFFTMLSLL